MTITGLLLACHLLHGTKLLENIIEISIFFNPIKVLTLIINRTLNFIVLQDIHCVGCVKGEDDIVFPGCGSQDCTT